jgi:16S rRNA (guanine527-N7)-methyltransferase
VPAVPDPKTPDIHYSHRVQVREKLGRRASRAGLSVSPSVLSRLEEYFELLRKWNRKVSLTALPVEEAGDEAVDRLLIEPLMALRYLPSNEPVVLDVGSGGGSPAIPMKIAAPGMSLRMVESKTRKAAFLREAVRALELENTDVESVRLEELFVRPRLHESADVVTLRAVRADRKLLIQLQLFLKPGGLLFRFGTALASGAAAAPHFAPYSTNALLRLWGSRLEILQKIH